LKNWPQLEDGARNAAQIGDNPGFQSSVINAWELRRGTDIRVMEGADRHWIEFSMIEIVTVLLGLFSATIFLVHAVDAYTAK
jgi:hypothetical protein